MTTQQYQFPKDFWWGSATSATQIEGAADEGGRGKNIWDYWYEIEPERFYNQVARSILLIFIIGIRRILH